MDMSAPVRFVMMTCEVLGVEYEFIVVNLMTGEHLKPEYLAVSDIQMNKSIDIYIYILKW